MSKLKKDKIHIAFLQETHLDDLEHAKLNKMGFKHVFFSSHDSGRRRGVAILISRALNYEHISDYKDKDARFVIITGKIEGIVTSLINVYLPPGSDWPVYNIFELMAIKSQGISICGGDFNIRLNPKLDSSNGRPDAKNNSKKIQTLMQEMGIVDVWREGNPISRDFTHFSAVHNVYSRIDYFFTFKKDLYRLDQCEIGPTTLSDHSPIYLSVNLNSKPRSTLWRLNSNILNNPTIKDKLKMEIKSYLEFNDNKEVTPSILWDALKAVIRGRIIAISASEKKIRQQKLKDLESKLKKLQKEHSETFEDGTKSKITELKKEIDEINTQEIQKKLLFLKQQYYEMGGNH